MLVFTVSPSSNPTRTLKSFSYFRIFIFSPLTLTDSFPRKYILFCVTSVSISTFVGVLTLSLAICTRIGSASLKSKVRDVWHTNHPVGLRGNHFTRSLSSILSSRPTVRTTTLMSSVRFSLPAKTRPLFATSRKDKTAVCDDRRRHVGNLLRYSEDEQPVPG